MFLNATVNSLFDKLQNFQHLCVVVLWGDDLVCAKLQKQCECGKYLRGNIETARIL